MPPASVEPVAARLEKMRIIKIRPNVITQLQRAGIRSVDFRIPPNAPDGKNVAPLVGRNRVFRLFLSKRSNACFK